MSNIWDNVQVHKNNLKITLTYHLVLISLAKIQKFYNILCSCGSMEKDSHMLLLGM